MKSIPKGYKQIFEGLIKEGDLLFDKLTAEVTHANSGHIGYPIETVNKLRIHVYRKQPSYTQEPQENYGQWPSYVVEKMKAQGRTPPTYNIIEVREETESR